ncbi:antitoxin [Actinomycetospora sp. C-140]
MVDFGSMADKAKDWAGENPEKADSFVDKGADFVNSKFAGHEDQVGQGADKAKEFLHGDQPAEGQAPPPPGEEPRP